MSKDDRPVKISEKMSAAIRGKKLEEMQASHEKHGPAMRAMQARRYARIRNMLKKNRHG